MPSSLAAASLVSLTRTRDELSIVCVEESVPAGDCVQPGWRCLQVDGPLDLSRTGIAAGLTKPLAEARVPVFLISTYDTDYLLVRAEQITVAISVLEQAGYEVAGMPHDDS